jgi:Y_Y_Y domain
MRNFFYVLIALCPFSGKAQPGHYFLSHYAPGDKSIDYVSFDMAQGRDGVLYLATRAGILEFDGRDWDLIPGNGAVYTILADDGGDIFWGGAKGFGKLMRAADGRMEAKSYSPPAGIDIYQAVTAKDQVYFLNDDAIYMCSKDGRVSAVPVSERSGSFTSLVEFFGTPYVSTEKGGVFKLADRNKLVPAKLGLNKTLDILFSSRLGDQYLFGTSDNRLFTCGKDLSLNEIKPEGGEYINTSVVVGGCWINSHLVAVATLRGGVIFIDPTTGMVNEIINYETGLPDNEVYALMRDDGANVWVSHDYGLTRIAPFLPFRSYSYYDGLKGNLLCAASYNNEVYVGTSVGLFKLVKEEIYDDVTYYVDVRQRMEGSNSPDRRETVAGGMQKERIKKKHGFFRFLKRNRDKVDPLRVEAMDVAKRNQSKDAPYVIHKESRSKRILRSEQYVYKQVEGIRAKVTNLLTVEGKLIACGLSGVFQIQDLSSTAILEDPVRNIFSTRDNVLIASTYGDKVRTLVYSGKQWKATHHLANLDDQIFTVFDGPKDEVWLCGLDRVYRIQPNDSLWENLDIIAFNNPDFSRTVALNWDGKVLLANAGGFFQFDGMRNSFVPVDTLPLPKAYFHLPGNIWYKDVHSWMKLGKNGAKGNTDMLSLCNDVRFIGPSGKLDNMWVINGNNELYEFSDKKDEFTTAFPLLLKSVTQGNHRIQSRRRLAVDQENGALTFNVVQPTYSGAMSTEYRYLVKGIGENWSEWSPNNNKISFPYLPQGSYLLQVEVRDIFGNVHAMKPLAFLVRPPFWKSTWFYAMEFTLFALLGFLSLKLSFRYRLVSRFLALLTIILLIEFIQTLAGYSLSVGSSPLINFALQVVVAFLILPVEGFLRNLMFKPVSADNRLFNVISELDRSAREESKIKGNKI